MFGKDIFNEQLVARKPNKKDTYKKIGIIILLIITIVIVINIPAIRAFNLSITMALVILVFFIFKRMNIEYEYIFTNGDLDIDKIINRNKRKSILSINVREFKIMAPINSKDYNKELNAYDKKYDFSSGEISDATYVVIYNKEHKRIRMIFEPNEQLLKAIKSYIPRTVKK